MLDIMCRRRSVRKFAPDMPDERDIERLVDAALLAPSAKDTRNVDLIVVRDKRLIERMAQCRADTGAYALESAPLALAIVGRPNGDPMWDLNAAVAATYILLEAEALGLGCCWVQMLRKDGYAGRPSDALVGDILSIPSGMIVSCVMASGHAAETKPPRLVVDLDRSRATYR